jgi:hypothetical protein
MSDKLVFDLAQEVEGSPNVFVRKDWLNILDNQNQNYNNNQSIIDTSQLSNSNKYMSYREAYLSIPFILTLGKTGATHDGLAFMPGNFTVDSTTAAGSCDHAIGLKNWFGQIIHSFTLDYNGTTIVQQTPYINMWNSFKLMTSFSLDDIHTQGSTIGFYPDDPLTWQFFTPIATPAFTTGGVGLCNNTNYNTITPVTGVYNNFKSGGGNDGFLQRQQLINFDPDGSTSGTIFGNTYSSLIFGGTAGVGTAGGLGAGGTQGTAASVAAVWKSYIFNKTPTAPATTVRNFGVIQTSVIATVYLKHIHSFFNMCPLLKGVFMKMTMNLNNTTSEFKMIGGTAGAGFDYTAVSLTCSSVSNPLGGVNPLMIASTNTNNGAFGLGRLGPGVTAAVASPGITVTYRANISVGSVCLDQQLVSNTATVVGPSSKSIYLYIPAYTFNPVFEQAYLSSPVKQIKYTDVYQYQVLSVGAGQVFNNLLTNGIANVKSVLILPFYNSNAGTPVAVNGFNYSPNSGFISGTPVWQSPYDPAGTGPTSPMCYLTNFNIQVSGQNAIYNTERYNFEQFNNQLYGQNAVNGGLTDGLTSGLIDRQAFDMEYSYYYVNVERMLPVEMSVPKSIQVLGQNLSSKVIDLYCFIEYQVEVSIDALTGARV